MRKVKRIIVDVLVDDMCDGQTVAEIVSDKMCGNARECIVLNSLFQKDVTEEYKENYPDIIV